jgi:hypothetical protein
VPPIFIAMHKSAETCNPYTEAWFNCVNIDIAIVSTVTHSTEAPCACARIIYGKHKRI